MYVCDKLPGTSIDDLPPDEVLKHEAKIQKQIFDIIDKIQSISIDSIMNYERFRMSMQPERTPEKPYDKDVSILAHFDLNVGNLLLDKKYNIESIIDWDTLSIAKNPNTDKEIFFKYWNRYKAKHTQQ